MQDTYIAVPSRSRLLLGACAGIAEIYMIDAEVCNTRHLQAGHRFRERLLISSYNRLRAGASAEHIRSRICEIVVATT
jgi:hypothetical protein